MEKIIVAVLVIGAGYWVFRLLKKEIDPDSGCSCSGKCNKKCPSDESDKSDEGEKE